MSVRSYLYRTLHPHLSRFPRIFRIARATDHNLGLIHNAAAQYFPQLIKPQAFKLAVAITADCNLRCIGCRYGRDFMPSTQLPWNMVRDLIDDAKQAGFQVLRLYGGEPLLHRDLPKMVEHGVKAGMKVYITTNAILLKEKIDELYSAGLREMSIGFYGVGASYDSYVQRKHRFAHLEKSIDYVRVNHGQNIDLQLNWLLMRPSCSVEALRAAYTFAEKYLMKIQVDLIHYSLPYFTEGPDGMLQFKVEDRPAIERVAAELMRLNGVRPEILDLPVAYIRSIPDWLLKGQDMRVPCEAYKMIWVGPDGTVQMCYVTFKLGNLYEQRLRSMLFTPDHYQAARDAFGVKCPNCHCGAPQRIQKHLASRRLYSRE